MLKKLCRFDSSDDLLAMTTKTGLERFESEIVAKQLGILGIIQAYGLNMAFEDFVNVCPILKQRLYTIASSSDMYPN